MGALNFTDDELSCKCGCGQYITDYVFLFNLQNVRDMYAKPMPLSSAFRCPEYNNKVSSTGLDGPHTIAAVDVIVHGHDAYRLLWLSMVVGFAGIGLNQKGKYSQRFIHLDNLNIETRPWVWTY